MRRMRSSCAVTTRRSWPRRCATWWSASSGTKTPAMVVEEHTEFSLRHGDVVLIVDALSTPPFLDRPQGGRRTRRRADLRFRCRPYRICAEPIPSLASYSWLR